MIDKLKLAHIDHAVKIRDKVKCIENKRIQIDYENTLVY